MANSHKEFYGASQSLREVRRDSVRLLIIALSILLGSPSNFQETASAFSDALVYTIDRPLDQVANAVEDVLAQNNYQFRASGKTGQQAAYVTERKIQNPLPSGADGFQNQFRIVLKTLSSNATNLSVNVDFARVKHGGRILSVRAEEEAEIA